MKSTPANPCVIAHFIGRGACVYCRLLSVLLMQIIKFGGKLVVNPRCSSIEHHNFKRNKAIFLRFTAQSASSWGCHRRAVISLYFLILLYTARVEFCHSIYISTQAFIRTVSFGVWIGVNGVWRIWRMLYFILQGLSTVRTDGQDFQIRTSAIPWSHPHRCSRS